MVGPGQHVLPAAQTAPGSGVAFEVLLQREDMRQFLHRMGDRLHVDDRHGRVLRERVDHTVFAVDRPVLELRERAHADQVDVARQHARDFGDVLLGFAVHDRAGVELDRPGVLAGLQDDRVAAELKGAEFEARARAHRRVEEQQRDRATTEVVSELVVPERGRLREQCVEFGAAPVLRTQKVANSHLDP